MQGQDKDTMHILFDDKMKKEFPRIFFKRKFGYKFPLEHHLTPTKHFYQPLLNFLQIFASNSDYIFFTQSVWQKKKISST